MTHPAIVPGSVAVITGGASGIGLAAAEAFARLGLEICIADRNAEALDAAKRRLAASAPGREVVAEVCDVASAADVERLASLVRARFGGADILMNNAGIQPKTTVAGAVDAWDAILSVNLMGIVHGVRAFLPDMQARGRPGLVINTGSKQGITTPPGNPAYNVSKAGVKAFTEALAHELRQTPASRLTAHLLIPGFVFTGLTAGSRKEKPAAAWTPEETVAFMLESLGRGDFYILCPDNDVPRSLDERRILWAAGDLVENRPALSRWHPDFEAEYAEFAKAVT